MKREKKVIVYRSKDRADWEKALALLAEAGIESFPFESEESPAPSCGAKIDPRKFMNKKPVPTSIFRIEVARSSGERAAGVLEGRVLPVRSYGFSV